MANNINYSVSVGEFCKSENIIEIARRLYNFTGFDNTIRIDSPDGYNGYSIVTSSGVCPWFSSIMWLIEEVEEKGLSMDFYAYDPINESYTSAQWRKGQFVYQRDADVTCWDEEKGGMIYLKKDEEIVLVEKGKKDVELKDYLEKNYESENEKHRIEDIRKLKEYVKNNENASELEKVLAETLKTPEELEELKKLDKSDPKNMSFTDFIEYQHKLSCKDQEPGELPF